MYVDCTNCQNGRLIEAGFDGRTGRECPACGGAGEIELDAEESAIMESFLAACAADLETVETVADVETFLGAPVAPVTPLPVHPNMTPLFFDRAVKRAFDAGLSISRAVAPGTVAVSSGTDDDTYYLVTRETCQCAGHAGLGRCYHRAFYLWFVWCQECDRLAARVPVAA